MKNEILFFVFTCIKNGRAYVDRLFNSLLSQTKINFVHFIYEDGSTDPIEDLVDNYRKKADTIGLKVIYEKQPINIGLNMATKHCIENCMLPYFIWIDCDNWVDNSFFEEMGKSVEKNPDAIVHRSRKIIFDEKKNKTVEEMFPLIEARKRKFKDNEKLIMLEAYWHSFFAVKANDFFSINNDCFLVNERHFYNDQQILFCCSQSKKDFVFVKKAKSYYFRRRGSESLGDLSLSFTDKMLDCFKSLKSKLICDKKQIDQLEVIREYYQIKRAWPTCYKRRDYCQCKKLIKNKRRILHKLGVPSNFAYLSYNSLLLTLSYLFPSLMTKLMKRRDRNKNG